MIRLPPFRPGMRIGLYGGSFDPPHAGHRHVAELALHRLQLDRIWWMVTPGNPLKDVSELASAATRTAATRRLARHPRMVVTEFEAELRSRYTLLTLRYLVRRCVGVRFVFIMGADSWAGFHRWRGWREIAELVPIAIVDRPDWTLRATQARGAIALGRHRRPEKTGRTLADARKPAWMLLHGPRSDLSSTVLRRRRARIVQDD
jgi:nicotinate-nucleotide adenylyltransferase